jgi:hypothetical protein
MWKRVSLSVSKRNLHVNPGVGLVKNQLDKRNIITAESRGFLPYVSVAVHSTDGDGEQLQEYVTMSEETLRTKHGSVRLSQTTLDEVEYIGLKASQSAGLYRYHNQLLDALSRLVGEGPTADPDTIKAQVFKMQDKELLGKLKKLDFKDLESAQPLSLVPPDNPAGIIFVIISALHRLFLLLMAG